MLLDTFEMQARDLRPAVTDVSSCRAFFRFDETSGTGFTESVSGGVYTPNQISADAGAIAFNTDYSITIGDNSKTVGDFIIPPSKPIAFGTDPIIAIVAGTTILFANTSHATIGDNSQSGSFGISTSNLHLAVTGDGPTIFGASYWPTAAQTKFGEVIYIAEYYPGGSSRFRIMGLDGSVGDDTATQAPSDVGNVTITNAGRFHGLNFRGAAWFSVTQRPNDLDYAARWMANQWKLGRKTLFPGCRSWA